MRFQDRTVNQLADMICGNIPFEEHFPYRTSSMLTEFFGDIGTTYTHNGDTRKLWVRSRLVEILDAPHPDEETPPVLFMKLVDRLMDLEDATNSDPNREQALERLNRCLAREGFEAFYSENRLCYLRRIGTQKMIGVPTDPHRPLTQQERERRQMLSEYLDRISEDELIELVLLPLFRQLNFHRITAPGHKDKSLEFGKDIWMRFRLPTQHYLYFGIQAKKRKIDATARSTANVAEIFSQLEMMLGNTIFDPETNKKVLVDHAFIVSGGEITKAAQQWLGEKLNNSKRSQVIFMDRNDILNLFVVTNMPLPEGALPTQIDDLDDNLPF